MNGRAMVPLSPPKTFFLRWLGDVRCEQSSPKDSNHCVHAEAHLLSLRGKLPRECDCVLWAAPLCLFSLFSCRLEDYNSEEDYGYDALL